MARRLVLVFCCSVLGLSTGPWMATAAPRQTTLIVSAAASLTFAFQELGPLFERQTGTKVIFNFASTGHLAQQIERGAPVDLFAAASMTFIDLLERQGLIISDTKRPYATGRLTLWTRPDSRWRFKQLEDLKHSGVRSIAIANPRHAPYGIAARQALQTAGLWKQLRAKLVMGENVRQALQYASTGNVDAALIALSLSVQHAGRWILLPASLHQPIVQALAVVKRTRHEAQARQFATFVTGPGAQSVLRKYGFAPPPGREGQ